MAKKCPHAVGNFTSWFNVPRKVSQERFQEFMVTGFKGNFVIEAIVSFYAYQITNIKILKL